MFPHTVIVILKEHKAAMLLCRMTDHVENLLDGWKRGRHVTYAHYSVSFCLGLQYLHIVHLRISHSPPSSSSFIILEKGFTTESQLVNVKCKNSLQSTDSTSLRVDLQLLVLILLFWLGQTNLTSHTCAMLGR